MRGYSFGKLVEVHYLEVVRSGIAAYSKQDFPLQLRAALDEFGTDRIRDCRVGYVDDNGVGNYYDALEFLANDGALFSPTITPATEVRL